MMMLEQCEDENKIKNHNKNITGFPRILAPMNNTEVSGHLLTAQLFLWGLCCSFTDPRRQCGSYLLLVAQWNHLRCPLRWFSKWPGTLMCWIGVGLMYKCRSYSKRELTPKTQAKTPGTHVAPTPSTHSSLLQQVGIWCHMWCMHEAGCGVECVWGKSKVWCMHEASHVVVWTWGSGGISVALAWLDLFQ